MFGFQSKKKDYQAICEWIREKWELSHTGKFNWNFDLGTHKVSVERAGFAIKFEGARMEVSYTEKLTNETEEGIQENLQEHTFIYFLNKIKKVEAVDAPNTELGFWGKPVLQLGVTLIPYEGEKAIIKKTTSHSLRILNDGTRTEKVGEQEEIQVLDMGHVYLGNGADLHRRGKQAFQDLIDMSGGLRKKEELY